MEKINIKENKMHYLLLGIVFLVAVIIRFLALGEKSLWIDEIYSYMFSHQKTFLDSLTYMLCDLSPPIYYLFLYFWLKIFGISEYAMRLPSAIFGIGSVIAVYFSVKKIFDKKLALGVATFAAFSPVLLYYSQEARGYSLLCLFAVITTAAWIAILNKINENSLDEKLCQKYKIFAFLTIFTHYWSFIFIFFQLVYAFMLALSQKKEIILLKKTTVKILFYSALVFLLQYSVLKQITGIFNTSIAKVIESNHFFEIIKFIFYENYYFPAVIALLLIFNLKKIKTIFLNEFQEKKLMSPIIYLSFTIILPVLVYLISYNISAYAHPRYLMFALPSIYLLIGYILSKIYEKNYNILIFVIAAVFLGIYLFVPQKIGSREFTYFNKPKQEWKEATEFVIKNTDKNTLIILDRVTDPFYDYYFNKLGKNINNYNFIVDREIFSYHNTEKKLAEHKKKYKKVYIFSSSMLDVNNIHKLMENPKLSCRLEEFININLYECN